MITVDFKTIEDRFITIEAKANEIYEIKYKLGQSVDILNGTDDILYASVQNDFSFDNGIGKFIAIPSTGAYNGWINYLGEFVLYIKANAAGHITLVKKDW